MILAIKSLTDVETAKLLYCAQYAHIGCGGAPVAWVTTPVGVGLGCTGCKQKWRFSGTLEEIIRKTEAFRSLVCN